MIQPQKRNLYFERPSLSIYRLFDIHPRTSVGDKVFYVFADKTTVHESSITGVMHDARVLRWQLSTLTPKGQPTLLAFWITGELIHEEIRSKNKRVTRPVVEWQYIRTPK